MNRGSTTGGFASRGGVSGGRLWRTCAWAVLCLVSAAARAAEPAPEPVTAVWKERLVHFSYRGFSAVYPCRMLENRVALVLTAVGARPDLEVRASHCDTPMSAATVGPGDRAVWSDSMPGTAPGYPATSPGQDGTPWTRSASEPGGGYYRRAEPRQVVDLRVRLSVPVAITPEVIEDLQLDRKRRELVARVTDDPLPLFDDPIPFAAQRQVVTLSRENGLHAVDCELLEQMASTVLRELGVRVLRRNNRCDRGTVSRIPPRLTVEAMLPLPYPSSATGGAATDDGDSQDTQDAQEPQESQDSREPP